MDFVVSKAGRLDAVLSSELSDISRNKIQDAIKNGQVMVNDEIITKASSQVQEGDEISIADNRQPTTDNSIKSIDQNLEVLYEDSSVMIINKPAGIAVHPGHSMDPGEETMLSGVKHLFEERNLPFLESQVLAHRLDKPTTGCLCVVILNNTFQEMQKQFENRTVKKTYLAVVSGVPEHAEATIDSPIGRNLTDRTKMSIMKTSVSRDARTSYKVLASTGDLSLLECDLHTGRTHQIRVHLSSIGHPILGDESYNSSESKKLSAHLGVQGLCLHAWKFGFVSPADQKEHFVEAPIPATISQVIDATGLQIPTD